MTRKKRVSETRSKSTRQPRQKQADYSYKPPFRVEYKHPAQKLAWESFQRHPVMFLLGPAGVGKSYLGMAFAVTQLLEGSVQKLVLTRPIVEAGESLGYLPGDFEEKVNPYMAPLFDHLNKLVGANTQVKEEMARKIEIAPLAYMRGRTFNDAVCIFDEAQNATKSQLKLFLSRMGENSKMIITGDPKQTDIAHSGLVEVVDRLESCSGVGIVDFPPESIVRHKLLAEILDRLEA